MSTYRLLLILLLIVPAAVILSVRPEESTPGFFADEAVYYAMARSLAEDGDLTWTRSDLEAICERYPAGPVGVILKKAENNGIYYAKPLLYPLAAAPFYRLFGTSGILLLNLLAFWMILRWISIVLGKTPMALIVACGGLFLSAFPPYILWIHTEIFTAFLLTGFTFHWFSLNKEDPGKHAIWMGMYLAGAVAIKPPLILLGVPAAIAMLRKRKWRGIAVFMLTILVIGLLSVALTGDINPYGGNRKIFSTQFPLDSGIDAFASGQTWSTESTEFHFDSNVFLWNLFFFFAGRYSGVLWYFLPGLAAVVLALQNRKNKRSLQLLLMILILILVQIIMIPANYHGGGGALGNRLFVNLYPLLLMCIPGIPRWRVLLPVAILASLFSGPFLVKPWLNSYQPGEFTKSGIYSHLPVEWTLTGAFPIFDPGWYRAEIPGIDGYFYFLDRHTTGVTEGGFSVYEGGTCRFIIELNSAASHLDFRVSGTHRPMAGTIDVTGNTLMFSAPHPEAINFTLPLGSGYHRRNLFGQDRWVYPVTCRVHRIESSPDLVPGQPERPAVRFESIQTAPVSGAEAEHPKQRQTKTLLPLYNE